MRFSIIVPIYNVQKYLKQAIESVLQEKFNNYELLLINDGSTDNCGEICNYYSENYEQVKTIHQSNGGLSDARNTGLKNAGGEYVIFLDGDDFLGKDILSLLSKVIDKAKSPDLISCVMNDHYSDGSLTENTMNLRPLLENVNRSKLYNEISKSQGTNWSAGKNVYKLSTIKQNKLMFKKGLIGAEDCDFFMEFVRVSNNFLFTEYTLTNYRREREGSITATMSVDSILGQLKVFSENYYFYRSEHDGMANFFAQKFANSIYLLSRLEYQNEIEKCLNFIHPREEILKNIRGTKYLGAKIIWSLFGYYHGSVLLRKANDVKNNAVHVSK